MDLKLLLQREFVKRCQKNPQYSLRAYAKSLSIQPSPLSAILRGKRPLTDKMKKRLGLALGLSLDEISNLVTKSNVDNFPDYQQLTLDTYAVISDWYHYAILELTRVQGFRPEISYVAKTLGLSNTETQIATERLLRLGLLKIGKKGEWIDATLNGYATNINHELTSQAAKKLQRQVLEMAIQALETLPTEVRSQTSMTMAVDPNDLPQAKEMIKKFRRELCAFFEKNKKPTQVYQLGISLYPLSQGSEK